MPKMAKYTHEIGCWLPLSDHIHKWYPFTDQIRPKLRNKFSASFLHSWHWSCVPLICPHKKILVDHLEIWDLQLTHWCCPGWPEGEGWLIPPVLLLLLRSWGQLVPATYIALSLHVELVSTWPIAVTVFSQETSVTQSGAPVCTAAWTKIILHSARTIWYSSDWIDLTKLVTGFPSNPCRPKDLFLFYCLAIVGCLHNKSASVK